MNGPGLAAPLAGVPFALLIAAAWLGLAGCVYGPVETADAAERAERFVVWGAALFAAAIGLALLHIVYR